MNEEEIKEIAYKLLVELECVFKRFYGKDYTTKLTKSDKMYTFCSDTFLLMFSIPDLTFFLSFMVYQSGNRVAKDTRLIMTVLDGSEFSIMEDSYFNNDTGELVFGNEALEVKQRDMISAAGKQKCPICDRILPKQYFSERGYCRLCEDNKSSIVYH